MSWLFSLEKPLKLERTTIHVAANLIDSYLWQRQLGPSGLKPLAFASLRIAAFQVEGVTLSHEVLESQMALAEVKSWSVDEMESMVTQLLKDRLRPPTVHCLLEIFIRTCGLSQYHSLYNYALFLADLAVLSHRTSVYLPSTIAVSCMKLALRKVASCEGMQTSVFEMLNRKIASAALHSSVPDKSFKMAARELQTCFRSLSQTNYLSSLK